MRPVWPDEKGTKPCAHCKCRLSAESFYVNPKSPTGLSSWCKACTKQIKKNSSKRVKERDPEEWSRRQRIYKTRYKEKHPEKKRQTERMVDLKRKYGMSLEEYENLFNQQQGKCAICEKSPKSNKHLAVDHDHSCCPGQKTCGKCVRGLLCYPCNAGLGGLENYLQNAEEYLNAYRTLRS